MLGNELPLCNFCLKPSAFKCSRCLITNYCSRECQVSDWLIHRNYCTDAQSQIIPNQRNTNITNINNNSSRQNQVTQINMSIKEQQVLITNIFYYI